MSTTFTCTLIVIHPIEIKKIDHSKGGPVRLQDFSLFKGAHQIEVSRIPQSGTVMTGYIARFTDYSDKNTTVLIPAGYLNSLAKEKNPSIDPKSISRILEIFTAQKWYSTTPSGYTKSRMAGE